MNVIVCFRNGISAKIASSANAKLQHLELKTKSLEELGLNVEFINLNKRNLSKVLEKKDIQDIPDYIYLPYDIEDIDKNYDYYGITAWLKKSYPTINIISYNRNNSKKYEPVYFSTLVAKKIYILDELILNNFNKSLKAEEKYVVNAAVPVQNLHIGKMNMTELDIQTIKNDNIHLFDTEKEADKFILKEIKENVCSIENDIKDLKKSLERKETMLNKCEALLKQKEQDFVNKYKSNIKTKKDIER